MKSYKKWFQRSVIKQLPKSCDNKLNGENKTENESLKKKLLSFWPFNKHSSAKNKMFIENITFVNNQKFPLNDYSFLDIKLGVYNKFCGMLDADIDLSVLPEQIEENNHLSVDNQMLERIIDPLNEPPNLNNETLKTIKIFDLNEVNRSSDSCRILTNSLSTTAATSIIFNNVNTLKSIQVTNKVPNIPKESSIQYQQEGQRQKAELKKLPERNEIAENICESSNNLSVLSDPDRISRKIRRNYGRVHNIILNMMKDYEPEKFVPYEPVSSESTSSVHTVASNILFASKDIISSTKREDDDDDNTTLQSLACAKLSKNSTKKEITNLITKPTTKINLNETYIVKPKETNSDKPCVVAVLKKQRDGKAPNPSNEMAWYPDHRPSITSKKIVKK
ncbi:hypothetical protein M0804_012693 [Polistes exclamans]|nr:hypothetical protein M0804_012693 [Polistes exclamans]